MIGAGRLEDDTICRPLREPFDERLTPALVVGEATGRAVGQAMSVEMVFRPIDADGAAFVEIGDDGVAVEGGVRGQDAEAKPPLISGGMPMVSNRAWARGQSALKRVQNSPPHAGVGEPLELGPALRRDRRQPVGVACLVDRIGDAAATGLAFSVRAPLGDAGALAGGEEGAPVRLGREGPQAVSAASRPIRIG